MNEKSKVREKKKEKWRKKKVRGKNVIDGQWSWTTMHRRLLTVTMVGLADGQESLSLMFKMFGC